LLSKSYQYHILFAVYQLCRIPWQFHFQILYRQGKQTLAKISQPVGLKNLTVELFFNFIESNNCIKLAAETEPAQKMTFT
jgi:hypothetical protein